MDSLRRILLVEDNEDLREELAYVLRLDGYAVSEAANGRIGMQVVSQEDFDLLITDIYMPDVDGLALSRFARSHRPEIKVILISGGGRDLNRMDDRDYLQSASVLAGADEVLRKPFMIDELLASLERLLEPGA